MNHKSQPPVYSKIALDIAARIGQGKLKEGAKIPGRSLMSSEYHVSPETIRRSYQLLEDMEIITVSPGSGAVVRSRENAAKYIDKFNIGKDFRSLKHELKELMKDRDDLNKKLTDVINQVFDINERYKNSNPLYTSEFEIPDDSSIIGKSINELNFWQNTGATIVAIKRPQEMILSPGPYYVFVPNDVIIVTGDADILPRIEALLSEKPTT